MIIKIQLNGFKSHVLYEPCGGITVHHEDALTDTLKDEMSETHFGKGASEYKPKSENGTPPEKAIILSFNESNLGNHHHCIAVKDGTVYMMTESGKTFEYYRV